MRYLNENNINHVIRRGTTEWFTLPSGERAALYEPDMETDSHDGEAYVPVQGGRDPTRNRFD